MVRKAGAAGRDRNLRGRRRQRMLGGALVVKAFNTEASRLLEPLSLLGIRYALKSGNWNYVFRLSTR
jgi:hypothetical protein